MLRAVHRLSGPEEKTPDYEKCIRISTQDVPREMLATGALVLFSLLVAGLGVGKKCWAGLLTGTLVSSIQLAIPNNRGGAGDDAQKCISSGGLDSGTKGRLWRYLQGGANCNHHQNSTEEGETNQSWCYVLA